MERVVIEWNNAGTIANATGAIFTHDSASLAASDVLILNPAGTWQPVRLSGNGAHDIDRIQVLGERGPNNMQRNRARPHRDRENHQRQRQVHPDQRRARRPRLDDRIARRPLGVRARRCLLGC